MAFLGGAHWCHAPAGGSRPHRSANNFERFEEREPRRRGDRRLGDSRLSSSKDIWGGGRFPLTRPSRGRDQQKSVVALVALVEGVAIEVELSVEGRVHDVQEKPIRLLPRKISRSNSAKFWKLGSGIGFILLKQCAAIRAPIGREKQATGGPSGPAKRKREHSGERGSAEVRGESLLAAPEIRAPRTRLTGAAPSKKKEKASSA